MFLPIRAPPESLDKLEKAIVQDDFEASSIYFLEYLFKARVLIAWQIRKLPSARSGVNRSAMAEYLLPVGIKMTDSLFQAAIKKKNDDFPKLYVCRGLDATP